jgi:quercetin dioxygenase-like cupin family protein
MSTATAQPYHLAAGEGQAMSWFTAQFQLKASDEQIGLMELEASPGIEPPLHVHRNEDEWYYVLDGTVTFHVGPDAYAGQAGSLVFLPRGVPHTFTIQTPSLAPTAPHARRRSSGRPVAPCRCHPHRPPRQEP